MSVSGGSGIRKCRECGRPFTPQSPHHWRCQDCQRRFAAGDGGPTPQPSGPPRIERRDGPPAGHEGQLPPGYLQKGYFDEKGHIWPSLLLEDADAVATRLGQQGRLSSTQLRNAFNKVRLIERRLDAQGDYEALVAQLAAMPALAALAVARGNAPEAFKEFIDRNVELAMRDETSFRKGLIPHFQSVICYFKYRYPRQ